MRRDDHGAGEAAMRVLALDDQAEVLATLKRILARRGFEVVPYTRPAEALAVLDSDAARFDLVLLDVNMPEMSGFDVLARARRLAPDLPVIMLTADDSAAMAVDALSRGAFHYLTKPVHDPDAVALTLRRAGQYGTLQRRTRELEQRIQLSERFETLIGATPVMRRLFATLDKVARSDVGVLICGESGTGKELAARAIHARSERAGAPFVALNCGAMPEALIDSELFGHTEGAFTGAARARAGVFGEADGGVLFLDEIGDIPAPVQLRLLRVLQEREVRPVGGSGSRAVDVRVVAATHVDLEAAVARKAFREDLYYRLNVVSLEMPPLRARMDDVPLLAAHLLEKHASRQARERVPRLSTRAMDALLAYRWPGNVRELENALQSALAMSLGDEIEPESLPGRILGGDGERTPDAGPSPSPAPEPERGPEELSWADEMTFNEARKQVQRDFERAYVLRLLARTRGNISEAARLAGLDRSNFRRIMSRHDIDAADHR